MMGRGRADHFRTPAIRGLAQRSAIGGLGLLPEPALLIL